MTETAPDYFGHPVFNPKRLRFVTPAMRELQDVLLRWLWTGVAGGLVYGKSRVGKSTALYLQATSRPLYTRSKQRVPMYYISMPDRDQKTIKTVFRKLCWSVDLRVSNADKADNLSERFAHHVRDRAVEAACPYSVLIVDEMQRLVPDQFNAFAELFDELTLLDLHLMVVFAGNDPECWHNVKIFESDDEKYSHIRGRFFTQGHNFTGLTSKEEVKECLAQYDQLTYPLDGLTYAAYFLPDAVKQGWQMVSLSDVLWRNFRDYQKQYQFQSWPMQYFLSTVNILLVDFIPHYGLDAVNDDMVQQAIRHSGLVPSLVMPVK